MDKEVKTNKKTTPKLTKLNSGESLESSDFRENLRPPHL